MSSGGECGARKCASVSVSESGIWSVILNGNLGATVTATLILTSTSILIATRSLSAKLPSIWSVTVILMVGCMHDHGPLCSQYCLDLCSVIVIVVCHVELRGCGVGRVVRLAMDRAWVLVLSLALALNLGSCAQHCRRCACAAWRPGQKSSPRAQDLT